jgi:hypothetical protein
MLIPRVYALFELNNNNKKRENNINKYANKKIFIRIDSLLITTKQKYMCVCVCVCVRYII